MLVQFLFSFEVSRSRILIAKFQPNTFPAVKAGQGAGYHSSTSSSRGRRIRAYVAATAAISVRRPKQMAAKVIRGLRNSKNNLPEPIAASHRAAVKQAIRMLVPSGRLTRTWKDKASIRTTVRNAVRRSKTPLYVRKRIRAPRA